MMAEHFIIRVILTSSKENVVHFKDHNDSYAGLLEFHI